MTRSKDGKPAVPPSLLAGCFSDLRTTHLAVTVPPGSLNSDIGVQIASSETTSRLSRFRFTPATGSLGPRN